MKTLKSLHHQKTVRTHMYTHKERERQIEIDGKGYTGNQRERGQPERGNQGVPVLTYSLACSKQRISAVRLMRRQCFTLFMHRRRACIYTRTPYTMQRKLIARFGIRLAAQHAFVLLQRGPSCRIPRLRLSQQTPESRSAGTTSRKRARM